MHEDWKEFAVYSDAASAEVVAGLLRSENVPVEIRSDEPIPGLARGFRLMVPTQMLQHAQMAIANAAFTEAELESFAAGQLDADDDTEE